MTKVNYIVEGLSSEYMKIKMKNKLKKIDGVNAVAIDIGHNLVEINYNNPATKEVIMDCIEDTGHLLQ
ncbi:heavy metal transporter [uncultured Clostridium sp.]|uniref:heavy metal transporter n=1 Tax=uncultured Clostridium sp. TaxID=59620 RepID=UPI00260143E6|nr:heavy metal transporter [uncultured Clostridium sp.]